MGSPGASISSKRSDGCATQEKRGSWSAGSIGMRVFCQVAPHVPTYSRRGDQCGGIAPYPMGACSSDADA